MVKITALLTTLMLLSATNVSIAADNDGFRIAGTDPFRIDGLDPFRVSTQDITRVTTLPPI